MGEKKVAQRGLKLNDWIEKYMVIVVPLVIGAGLLFGETLYSYTYLVPYLFAYVTFAMAIGCSFEHIKDVFSKPLKLLLLFGIIHVLLPLLVYWLAGLVFGYHSPYVIGLVMFTLIPVGISAVMWVSMTGGNVSLMLAIVIIDSLLSPIIITGGLRLLFHATIQLDTVSMLIDLLLIIVLPTVLGIALHELTKGRIVSAVKPYSAPLSKLCFMVVVALNAAALTPSLDELKQDLLRIIPISIAIVLLSYLFGYLSAMRLIERADRITLSYASGIRNVSLGAVIALTYFSPQTAMPILLGILLQQPIATTIGLFLQTLNKTKLAKASRREYDGEDIQERT